MNRTWDLVDRSRELSFDRPGRACTSKLLETGIVVVKKAFSEAQIDAARIPYLRRRALTLAPRVLAKGVAGTIGQENALYRVVHPGYVRGHPSNLPHYMRPIEPVVKGLVALNNAMFEDERLQDKYGGGKTDLNLIGIQRSSGRSRKAFPQHQDSRGVTGLGYATQGELTKWNISGLPQAGEEPEVAYSFFTHKGDTVVLAERAGPCPEYIPPGQGEKIFFEDGSVIHEGWNPMGIARYAIVGFCEELPEGAHRST